MPIQTYLNLTYEYLDDTRDSNTISLDELAGSEDLPRKIILI